MSRPKKGTKGHYEAVRKWHETMLEKCGGNPDKLHKRMQAMGAKGGKASTSGGFASNRELAIRAGALGGSASRRGTKTYKKILESNETAIEMMYFAGDAYTDIAKAFNVGYGTMRRYIIKRYGHREG